MPTSIFLSNVFNILAKYNYIVDLISTSKADISLGIPIIDTEFFDKVISELSLCGEVTYINNMVILSIIGKGMKNNIGIAGKLFNLLGKNKVNIEMISQGASEINISCIIHDKYSDKILKIVHDELIID